MKIERGIMASKSLYSAGRPDSTVSLTIHNSFGNHRRSASSASAAIERASRLCPHATDPALMQEILVGGAIASAVSAAFVNGIKQEPSVCSCCAGNGGIKCFACEGAGRLTPVKMEDSNKRDALGRSRNRLECRACKGAGLLFCKQCNGTGYVGR